MKQRGNRVSTRRGALLLVVALMANVLTASPAVADTNYVVVAGDTLSAIAEEFAITLNDLLDANGLTLESSISVKY